MESWDEEKVRFWIDFIQWIEIIDNCIFLLYHLKIGKLGWREGKNLNWLHYKMWKWKIPPWWYDTISIKHKNMYSYFDKITFDKKHLTFDKSRVDDILVRAQYIIWNECKGYQQRRFESRYWYSKKTEYVAIRCV